MQKNIRKLVYHSLLSCVENGRYSNLEADSAIEKNALSDRDKSFYTVLFYGVTEKQITLDYQIKKLSKIPPEKLETNVKILLRMGIYQIIFMNSVPDRAAVYETVALARENVNAGAVGYINGILRSAARECRTRDGLSKIITPDKERDICGYLSIFYSFPRYLCKLWINAYGREKAEEIMKAQNRPAPITLRVNTLKTSTAKLLEKLTASGIQAVRSGICDDGIIITGSNTVTKLPGFDSGDFFVQDDSSRLCISELNPQPGELILDACACPGGKSFACALLMKNTGKIISCDIHKNKLSLINEGATRLGISIIETKQSDSSVFNPESENRFDRVLCDVPCSGFGTISKKPDLRLKDAQSVAALPELQLSILKNCSGYVKSGGVLVYSTCTLNPSENENNAALFASQHRKFELISQNTNFPCDGQYDGFYYAKFLKKK